jgi:hypothetical protein
MSISRMRRVQLVPSCKPHPLVGGVIDAMDTEETEYGDPLRFREDDTIVSQVLTGLSVTAQQIFGGGAE